MHYVALESKGKIQRCYYLKEKSSAELLDFTIYFLIPLKVKFWFFVGFWTLFSRRSESA